jgi:hypothetical protein
MADESGLFSPTNMSTLLAAAMLEKMSTTERDLMLAGALTYLMTPKRPPNSYGSEPAITPIDQAFRDAANTVIRKVAEDTLEASEEFKTKLEALVVEALQAALAGDSDFHQMIGRAVAEALSKRHRGY